MMENKRKKDAGGISENCIHSSVYRVRFSRESDGIFSATPNRATQEQRAKSFKMGSLWILGRGCSCRFVNRLIFAIIWVLVLVHERSFRHSWCSIIHNQDKILLSCLFQPFSAPRSCCWCRRGR